MDWLRDYLLRLICAAVFCGVLTGVAGRKGALGATVKLLAGVFMVTTVVSPWLTLRLGDFTNYFEEISANADGVIAYGEKEMEQALADIIKSKAEAYILDKADSYGAELIVEVRVESSGLPAPCAVSICGSISPYGRKQMEHIIANELGIALEDQLWTG